MQATTATFRLRTQREPKARGAGSAATGPRGVGSGLRHQRRGQKLWDDLVKQAPANTLEAWRMMRTDPIPNPWTSRQHPLKGALATGTHGGRELPQWHLGISVSDPNEYLQALLAEVPDEIVANAVRLCR